MSLLLDDLRKRRVVKVAIAYVLAAAALLLVVSAADDWFRLPEWTLRLVAAAAFVMMPFVLVMTWALEDHGPENLKMLRRRR